MRFNLMTIANESIDFQDGAVFAELTKIIDEIKNDDELARMDDRVFYESRKVSAISEHFKKQMGLSFSVHVIDEFTGPAIETPMLDKNHVFWNEGRRLDMDMYGQMNGISGQEDVDKIMKMLNTKIVKGTVDLKKAKVTGVFEQMQFKLFLPRTNLMKKKVFTAQEVAAVILHEVGHMFTYMEFLTRTVSANQVLAGIVRATDKSVAADKREIVFIKGAEMLDMTKSQREALFNAKSQKEICCVVLDSAIQKSVSELGTSAYDVNSCEYLADQFATRMGAGRYLVSYLDSLYRDFGITPTGPESMFVSVVKTVLVVAAHLFFTLMLAGIPTLFMVLMIYSEDKQYNIYDNDKARFTRIKHQNIERLKDASLSKEQKLDLIQSNDAIDKIAKCYVDELQFIQKAAYFLRPSYRNAHKFELLQKELESFANNDLFQMSAKLSTV